MNRSPGILTPLKTPDGRSSESPDDEPEETFATRAREEIHDSKYGSKCVRVLTVLAYVLCVSMAAILLSLYYVLVWDPPKHQDYDEPDSPSALRADRERIELDIYTINRSMWEESPYNNDLNNIPEPTPIPVMQNKNTLTTANSSIDYVESLRVELEVPEYEDTFVLLNNNETFVEKEKRYAEEFRNNITGDLKRNGDGLLMKRLINFFNSSSGITNKLT